MTLSGTFGDMSLHDVFDMLHMGGKSGLLVVTEAVYEGVICVADGMVLDTLLVRRADRVVVAIGHAACARMIRWRDATFRFEQTPMAPKQQRRMRRHINRTCDGTITRETCLELVTTPSVEMGDATRLHTIHWRILSQLSHQQDGRCTIDSIIAATGLDAAIVIETVQFLLHRGMIAVSGGSCSPTRLHNHEGSYVAALVA